MLSLDEVVCSARNAPSAWGDADREPDLESVGERDRLRKSAGRPPPRLEDAIGTGDVLAEGVLIVCVCALVLRRATAVSVIRLSIRAGVCLCCTRCSTPLWTTRLAGPWRSRPTLKCSWKQPGAWSLTSSELVRLRGRTYRLQIPRASLLLLSALQLRLGE